MAKSKSKTKDPLNVQANDPRTLEQFKNFIGNDDVMMSVYKDDGGTMYVALSDRKNPSCCIVVTAEAMCKSANILEDVFDSKSTNKVESVLN